MVLFGQIVVGPPGSGKTTYCMGMQMFMDAIGRKCAIINLDFANDRIPYTPAIDVRDLMTLEKAMEENTLGPNGSLVYCMEFLLENIDWLTKKVEDLKCNYVIFDCPGQVELYTHHDAVHEIIKHFVGNDFRLASIFLIDSFYCCEASTFISAVLVVASCMLRLGLPHISILSKIDLINLYGPMPFNLDFFTELVDLSPLVRYIDSSVNKLKVTDYGNENVDDDGNDDSDDESSVNESKQQCILMKNRSIQEKHRAMSEALCDTLNDFGLVSFLPLDIQNKELVGKALAAIDKANGYSFASKETARYRNYMKEINQTQQKQNQIQSTKYSEQEKQTKEYLNNLFNSASKNMETVYSRSLEIQEKYIDYEDIDS